MAEQAIGIVPTTCGGEDQAGRSIPSTQAMSLPALQSEVGQSQEIAEKVLSRGRPWSSTRPGRKTGPQSLGLSERKTTRSRSNSPQRQPQTSIRAPRDYDMPVGAPQQANPTGSMRSIASPPEVTGRNTVMIQEAHPGQLQSPGSYPNNIPLHPPRNGPRHRCMIEEEPELHERGRQLSRNQRNRSRSRSPADETRRPEPYRAPRSPALDRTKFPLTMPRSKSCPAKEEAGGENTTTPRGYTSRTPTPDLELWSEEEEDDDFEEAEDENEEDEIPDWFRIRYEHGFFKK
ncbi:hypothetical protein TWF281_004218 [Arthrobotrys megalospora]